MAFQPCGGSLWSGPRRLGRAVLPLASAWLGVRGVDDGLQAGPQEGQVHQVLKDIVETLREDPLLDGMKAHVTMSRHWHDVDPAERVGIASASG